jgi:hypothetical protein
MSTWPRHDLPHPGRCSLARVVAARKGHARRRAKALPMTCPTCNTGTPGACDCPQAGGSACSELLEEGEPLTRREAVEFWLITAAPAAAAGLGFALLVWWLKP